MLDLTDDEVKAIARLAHLELSQEDVIRYRQQLASMLKLVSKVQQADAIVDIVSEVPVTLPERPDQSEPSLSIGDVLANAPESTDSSFKTPKIIGAV